MATKRFPLGLVGSMVDNTTFVQGPRQSTVRTVSACTLLCNGDVPADVAAQFKLTLDAGAGPVVQSQALLLPTGSRIGENNVVPAVVIPANVYPGIICTLGSGASYVVAWISYFESAVASSGGGGWITLSADDLDGHIALPYLAAYTSTLLTVDSDALKTNILSEAIEDVRGWVSGYGPNTLGAEGTIPAKLKWDALNFAVATLYERVPGVGVQADAIKTMFERYKAKMEKVAEGTVRVPIPTVTSGELTASPSPRFNATTGYTGEPRVPIFSRDDQEGI